MGAIDLVAFAVLKDGLLVGTAQGVTSRIEGELHLDGVYGTQLNDIAFLVIIDREHVAALVTRLHKSFEGVH